MENINKHRTVAVTGVGKLKKDPDWVEVRMVLRGEHEQYEEAILLLQGKSAELSRAVQAAGFSEKDLKTEFLQTDPLYETINEPDGRSLSKIRAYEARQGLKLAFALDTDLLGKALEAAQTKESQAEISLQFTVRDPEALKEELVQLAVEQGRRTAEALCRATGGELGRILHMSQGDWDQDMVSDMRYSGRAGGARMFASKQTTALLPTEIELETTCRLVWEII